jgi:2,4-dienoyl-CoA reductase-like NADH-dependent reductase (Old Yellow Enzyme family)
MAALFQPLALRGIQLKNRIVVSPMCQYSSEDGFVNDWHIVHLGSRAVGGAALIITEATSVSPEGRITHKDLGIWKDEHIEGLKRITQFIESQQAIAGIQLAHAGRKASHHIPWEGGTTLKENEDPWQTVAPSAVPFTEAEPTPAALDNNGIQKVIADFKAATHRALKAGFKVIEIHAAHGYLFHEFFSPLSNKRTDEYGGSFENRIRLLLQVVDTIRQVWPEDYPLFVRISATDWVDGGWTVEDSIALANVLKNKGVDLMDCSTGGNIPGVKIPIGPMYQLEFATQIKKATGMRTGAVGIITKPLEAEMIIANEEADVVLLARQFLRDPYFPLHAAKELGVDVPWPSQYERAKKH